jgi:hypothetical protein
VSKLSEESVEELRFEILKRILAEFPELRERLKEYLLEDSEKKEEKD